MSKQTINIGASPNDGTGTPLRTSFDYCNQNFTELYTATGPSGNNIVVPGNATITGDLTVRTNKLKVDATGVGIGTTSPTSGTLTVQTHYLLFPDSQTKIGDNGFCNGVASDGNSQIQFFGGKSLFFNEGASNTKMTLNSTGLGIGGSPASKLSIADTSPRINFVTTSGLDVTGYIYNAIDVGTGGKLVFGTKRNGNTALDALTIDSSQNVGIGVTPSASWVTYKALEFDTGIVSGSSSVALNRNCYFDGVNWRYKVLTSFGISQYQLSGNGSHIWNIASSGSAGALINGSGAWTQAMTLDASGYLLLGTTDTTFTSGAGYKFGPGATPSNGQVGASSSNGDLTLRVYSTGAAAYRFYVGFGGTVFATSATISAISDARLKENVQNLDVGLNEILALKPRKFDWKAGKGKDIKGDRGFIAQEFETVFPNLIDEWADPAPEGEAPYKSVRQDLIPVLVKAIQELTARVQTLETR